MSFPIINFASERIKFSLLSKSAIKKWLAQTAAAEGFQIAHIRFVFCNDEFLVPMNKKYLQHNTYTDIITFDYSERQNLSGEIYISIERVKENAKQFNTVFDEELRRVIIHGLLHLCGHSDKRVKAKEEMRKMEDKYLRLFTC